MKDPCPPLPPAGRPPPNRALRLTFSPPDTRGRCWLRCHPREETNSQLPQLLCALIQIQTPSGSFSLAELMSFACTLGAEKSRRASARAWGQAVAGLPATKTYAMGIPQMWAGGTSGQTHAALLFSYLARALLFGEDFLGHRSKTLFWTHVTMTAWANNGARADLY